MSSVHFIDIYKLLIANGYNQKVKEKAGYNPNDRWYTDQCNPNRIQNTNVQILHSLPKSLHSDIINDISLTNYTLGQ